MSAAHESAREDCPRCSGLAEEPPGGWVYEDDLWATAVFDHMGVPGWLMTVLKRHAEATTELTQEEAESLGPLMVKLSRAIEEATGCERVYMQMYGEHYRHWHFMLCAREEHIPAEHRVWNFSVHHSDYVDLERAHEVAGRIRAALAHEATR